MDKKSVCIFASRVRNKSFCRTGSHSVSLVVAYRGVSMNVNKGDPADKVYLHFQNTFDKALHQRLLKKLSCRKV